MPTAWASFDTTWTNFGNWLGSSAGWVFYVALAWMIILVVLLIFFRRLRRTGELKRLPAILSWLVLSGPPVVFGLMIFTLGNSATGYDTVVGTICLFPFAVPLVAGLIVLARLRENELSAEA